MRFKKIGKIFHAEFKTEGGDTRSVTTRCTELGEARRVARESGLEQLEHAAKAGRLTQQVVGKIITGKKLTMAKAIHEFAEWQASIGKSPRTIENNGWVFTNWFEWDKTLAAKPPSAVTEKHINAFINRPDIRAGAVSRNVMLVAVRSLFEFCNAKGWAIGNPARLVAVNFDLLSHEQKEKEEVVPFTESEYKKVIAHLAGHETPNHIFWQVATYLAWETGLRISDVTQLEWDCFKMAGKVIVWTGKRNKRVAVPIPDALSRLITEIPLQSAKYLFPDQRMTSLDQKKRAGLSVQFSRIATAAGVKDKSFHALRHACITRWKNAGKTLEDIGVLVGHSSTKTTQDYVHG